MVKIIHYCWFGGKPFPDKVKKCIESWKKFLPDFEIMRWDETNFDVNCCKYVQQAYNAGKWAFVSDYARFWALEKYGGLYFDTDVEVIRPLCELLRLEAFAGFETERFVAPGLVLWVSEPGNSLMIKMRQEYDTLAFLDENGERIRRNVCDIFTSFLEQYGFKPDGSMQCCGGMTLFPKDYFCPFDDATGLLHITENTYTIHWYDKSWMPAGRKLRNKCTRIIHRIFGSDIRERIFGKR